MTWETAKKMFRKLKEELEKAKIEYKDFWLSDARDFGKLEGSEFPHYTEEYSYPGQSGMRYYEGDWLVKVNEDEYWITIFYYDYPTGGDPFISNTTLRIYIKLEDFRKIIGWLVDCCELLENRIKAMRILRYARIPSHKVIDILGEDRTIKTVKVYHRLEDHWLFSNSLMALIAVLNDFDKIEEAMKKIFDE